MKRRGAAALVVAVVILVMMAMAFANENTITGNKWREFSAELRLWYVIGVVDGILEATALLQAAEPRRPLGGNLFADFVARTRTCLVDTMTRMQVGAIVDKYVKDHPAQWHFPMTILTVSALREACPAGNP